MDKAAYYIGNKNFEVKNAERQKPGKNQVSVRVAYCGICGTDVHIFQGRMDERVKPPKIIGHEMSGTVVEIGEDVAAVRPGDLVVVRPLDWCGACKTCERGHVHICERINVIGVDSEGAFQSVIVVHERTLHKLDSKSDLKTAALTEPLAVACHDVRMGQVSSGDYCVVIGGGPIGVLIALAAAEKGGRVVLLELNEKRAAIARSMGIRAVDPRREDVKTLVQAETGGTGADVVFEVSASKNGALMMTDLACPRGRIVLVGVFSDPMPVNLKQIFLKELKIIGARLYEARDFDESIRLITEGAIRVDPLISKVVPMEGIVEAFTELEGKSESMKILVTCSD